VLCYKLNNGNRINLISLNSEGVRRKDKIMGKSRVITVQNIRVTVSSDSIDDYICITDMAGAKTENSRAADIIRNWLRNRITLEFLGTWEQIYNPDFKVFEFEHFKKEAGLHTFGWWEECI